MLSEIRHSLRGLFLQRKEDRVLDSELQFHIEQETQENVRRGMPLDEARRNGQTDLGGLGVLKEECRDEYRTRVLENIRKDILYALRGLRKNPSYAAVA